jgi:allantoin racemase
MKIRWQSFVDENLNNSYLLKLSDYLNSVAGPEVNVEVIGMTPPARDFGRLQEFRCARIAVINSIQAERDGCDAFVIGHFQEPGLYEARSACDIPVIGIGESTILWASHLGRRIGLVSLDDVFEVIHLEQMDRYGLGGRIAGISAINIGVEDFSAAFQGDSQAYSNIVNKFREVAKKLVAQGADVIVPAGGLFGLLTAEEQNFKVGLAPVIPSTPITLGWAENAAKLYRNVGLTASRGSSFAKASERSIQDFLGQ